MKLEAMHALCWFMTIVTVGVVIFQIWFTCTMWNDFGTGAGILYALVQALILLYASYNVVVAWHGYLYEKYLYDKDSKYLYHL